MLKYLNKHDQIIYHNQLLTRVVEMGNELNKIFLPLILGLFAILSESKISILDKNLAGLISCLKKGKYYFGDDNNELYD
jgi:hypothetical protein